ncbi:MAG: hypothetical protein WCR08_09685 [Gammaproteobacteria bacterium]
MGATTTEGTGQGSASNIKPLVFNGSVKTVNIEPNAVTAANLDNNALSKAPFVLDVATITLDSSKANIPLILDRLAGVVVTLPAATGTGDTYKFYVKTTVTSNVYKIQVANGIDIMSGVAFGSDDETPLSGTPTAIDMWIAGASDDTITMDGSTKGGKKGNHIEILDMAAGIFHVRAVLTQTATEVTPFSNAVS